MKKLMIFLTVLFIFPIGVFAKATTSCDYSLLSNLKDYASNINIIYDYYIKDNNAYFNVTINNITSDMYIIDAVTDQRYNYSDTNNGELIIKDYKNVETLKYNIYSTNPECPDQILINQYITLPVYNKFSGDKLCDGIENYKLCNRFLKTNISYDEFKEQVTEYKRSLEKKEETKKPEKEALKNFNSWQDLVIRYSPLVLIILVVVIILIIKRRKKNQFDFKL